MVFTALKDIVVNDSFWRPKLKLLSEVTVNDVFNKFEGQYEAGITGGRGPGSPVSA